MLFLGGWHTGFLPGADRISSDLLGMAETAGMVLGNVLNVVVFILKGWVLVFVMMWVRWTLPRLRIDQVMMTCLKYLLPISCVLLLGVSLWQVAVVPAIVRRMFSYVLCAVCLALFVWMVVQGRDDAEPAAAVGTGMPEAVASMAPMPPETDAEDVS